MSKIQPLNSSFRQAFTRLIIENTGLTLRDIDQDALSEKIAFRLKALKLTKLEDYYQFLTGKDSTQEWRKLVTLITNNETYFFRDKEQINLLRQHIFPEIIERQKISKSLRICSAGCSTGEEPYSLAILLREMIPNFKQWQITILGIDISDTALQKAKEAVYSSWSFRGVDPKVRQKYFRQVNNEYHLNQEIKQMVKFQNVNLVKDPFPRPNTELRDMDLIICRNVFIYFDALAVAKVLDKIYQTLRVPGYFITGHTELCGQNVSSFQKRLFPQSVVYQRCAEDSQPQPIIFTAPISQSNLLPALPKTKPIERPKANNNGRNFFKKGISNQTIKKAEVKKRESVTITKASEPKLQSDQELFQLAEELYLQNRYDRAIAEIESGLKKEPNNYRAYCLLAKIYANWGKYEEAFHYCNEALKINDFAVDPLYLLARLAEEQENISEAKRIFKKILYLEPTSVAAYLDLSQIYGQEGDQIRADKMRQSALDLLRQLPPETKISEKELITAAELIQQLNFS